MTTTKVTGIRLNNGIAGQFSYTATVQHPGELPGRVEFVGSVYGDGVVMVDTAGAQTHVSSEVIHRIGSKLSPEWVRAFYDTEER